MSDLRKQQREAELQQSRFCDSGHVLHKITTGNRIWILRLLTNVGILESQSVEKAIFLCNRKLSHIQGQAGCSSKQPDVVGDVPDHCRRVELHDH